MTTDRIWRQRPDEFKAPDDCNRSVATARLSSEMSDVLKAI